MTYTIADDTGMLVQTEHHHLICLATCELGLDKMHGRLKLQDVERELSSVTTLSQFCQSRLKYETLSLVWGSNRCPKHVHIHNIVQKQDDTISNPEINLMQQSKLPMSLYLCISRPTQ